MNADCSLRSLVFPIAYFVVFSYAVVGVITFTAESLSAEAKEELREELRGVYGDVKNPDERDERIEGELRWLVAVGVIVATMVVLLLIRLYLSMEVFDVHAHYFHRWLVRMPMALRVAELAIRLVIVIVLLWILKTTPEHWQTFLTKSLRFKFDDQVAGYCKLRNLMFVLALFFALHLLWDVVVAGTWCVYGLFRWKVGPPKRQISPWLCARRWLVRFVPPHAMGLATCWVLGYALSSDFLSKTIGYVVLALLLGALNVLWVLLDSVFGCSISRGDGLKFFRDGWLLRQYKDHFRDKIRSFGQCEDTGHIAKYEK
jgi:hypothetical protein